MAEPTDTPDVDIEDVSLIENDIAPAQDAPSEPASEGQDESADTQDKPGQSDEATTAEDEQPSQEQPEKPAEDDVDAQKRHNEAMAQKRIQERQRTRQAVAQQLDQTYGPKTAEDLQAEGLTPEKAEIQALREEMAYERRKTEVAELNANLQVEAVNVFHDFPMFNPESKDYDEQFTQEVEQAYQTAARLQTDESGIILNAEVPLYDFYQRMATIYNRGQSRGSESAKQDTLQMLARTENVGGSSSTSGNSGDSLKDLEDRIGDVVIT